MRVFVLDAESGDTVAQYVNVRSFGYRKGRSEHNLLAMEDDMTNGELIPNVVTATFVLNVLRDPANPLAGYITVTAGADEGDPA